MSPVSHDPETGEPFDPDAKCSWCRKPNQPKHLVWVAINDQYQWICDQCYGPPVDVGAPDPKEGT